MRDELVRDELVRRVVELVRDEQLDEAVVVCITAAACLVAARFSNMTKAEWVLLCAKSWRTVEFAREVAAEPVDDEDPSKSN